MWIHVPNSENYHYSVVAAEVCLQPNTCYNGTPFAMSNTRPIQWKYSKPESETDYLTMRQFGITSERSTASIGVDTWTLLPPGFRVNRSAQPESEKPTVTCETGGRQPFALLERYNQDIVYWKTSQGCFLLELPTDGPTLAEYSQTWQKAGLMQNGECYQQPKQAQRIKEIGCGLWPTPKKTEINESPEQRQKRRQNPNAKMRGRSLTVAVKLWPTPRAGHDTMCGGSGHKKKLQGTPLEKNRGQLNPQWVEWLMGWPIGWTSLDKLNPADFQHWLEATLARTWWAVDPADLGEPETWPTPRAVMPDNLTSEPEIKNGRLVRKSGQDFAMNLRDKVQMATATTGPIPRLTTTKKNRTNRLKALGNGQVSICAAVAWRLLTRDFEI